MSESLIDLKNIANFFSFSLWIVIAPMYYYNMEVVFASKSDKYPYELRILILVGYHKNHLDTY